MRKTAILVVYFMNDADVDILDLHLSFIQQCSAGEDYKILAAANRVSDFIRSRLAACPDVELVNLPATELRGSEEHSHYLDVLTRYAVDQGFTHVVTMDCDAFPIREGWLPLLLDELTPGKPVLAVFRQENGDKYLPHPLTTCFSADFYREHPFHFYPDRADIDSPAFREFSKATGQIIDSGVGLGFYLFHHKIEWGRMLRSNRVDDHYLLAGIYHDAVFHLGSMSRPAKMYRLDGLNSWRIRLAMFIRYHFYDPPKNSPLRKAMEWFERPAIEAKIRSNGRIYQRIREQLMTDPRAYMRYLRGGE